MGPPELPGGNMLFLVVPALLKQMLQWGRRNYPAETRPRGAGEGPHRPASMGPPELPGGNRKKYLELKGNFCGFNGAAGITRRKPAVRRARTERWIEGFNGAAGITRRKPAAVRFRSIRRLVGFNGAAGITRRKHAVINAAGELTGLLQWGRRNYPAETSVVSGMLVVYARQLQWGRRNYPAETSESRCGLVFPRRFNGAAGITRRKRRGSSTPYL